MDVLGIDIGSYGIKGCIVDTEKGELISDRYSTPPLDETAPHKILARLHDVVNKHFKWKGPVGCAFPAAVNRGVVLSAKRIDDSWTDADATQLFSEITDNPVSVINDTDATGIAEMRFGSGKNHHDGTVIVLTVGTGIGSSLFRDGLLVPNTELGLIEIGGATIEKHASNRTRKEEGIRKKTWGKRLQEVLEVLETIFHPDLFILGGQLSRKADKTFPYIKINTAFKAAGFMNDASIVGAAIVASGEEAHLQYQ
ncbi:polyphosphate--glucose phosphotransferase [Halalkalibaculum sp. DA3122]|uniref:polyphosphate--glucose phosphotransferase n=1 Tax=unclassified Halalkalibaculum TaxID=2964617 RepID=UPI0037540B47